MKAIKKFFTIIYVIFLITNLNAHSYPPIEPVPEKFKTWINHYNDLHIEFDFCNYEMSFLDNFKGFGKICGGSWYASSLSKYLVKNRQYLTENYAFFCRILISPYAQKRSLKESLKTFKLIYDEETGYYKERIVTAKAFGQTAEFINSYYKNGDYITLDGKYVDGQDYENNDGRNYLV